MIYPQMHYNECHVKNRETVYRFLLESAPVAILVFRGGRFLYANQEAADLYGFECASMLINKPIDELVHVDDLHIFQETIRDDESDGQERLCRNLNMVRRDNRVFDLKITSVPIVFDGKKARLAACVDITERKRAEASVINHLIFLETIIDTIPNPIFYKDIHGAYLGCNTYFARKIIGLPRSEIIGKTVYDFPELIPQEYADIYHEHDQKLFMRSGVQVYEAKVRCADEEIRDYLFYKAVYQNTRQGEAGLVGIMVDITETKKVEKSLYRYQQQLRELTNSMALTEELERHRIARNLQEQIGQTLAVSSMKLGALRTSAMTPDMMKALDEIRSLIGRTIQDARSLTFELSPPVLHELGLKAAFEWLVEKFDNQGSIRYAYCDDGKVIDVDDTLRVMLFRAARELLFNVAFHSNATHSTLSLFQDKDYIYVRVQDNGIGFDLTKIDTSITDPSGFGIFSIQERMNHLGGRFEIQSQLGEGTQVTIASPKNYYRTKVKMAT